MVGQDFLANAGRYMLDLSQEIYATKIWSASLLYAILMFANALGIGFILEHFVAPSLSFAPIVSVFSSYSFVIGVYYNSWQSAVQARRYASLRQYMRMVETSKNTVNQLHGLYRAYLFRPLAESEQAEGERAKSVAAANKYLEIRDIILVVTWYSYRLFHAEDPRELSYGPDGAGEEYVSEFRSEQVRAVVDAFRHSPTELTDELMPKILEDMADLQRLGAVNDVLVVQVLSQVQTMMESIANISIEATMHEPKIYSAMAGLMTVFWVFVWMPVNVWVALGTLGTSIFYPILGFVLTGTAVFDFFRGNTFDAKTVLRIGDPHKNRLSLLRAANKMSAV